MILDENNQVPGSLMARKSRFVRGIDFDMHNDRGIISSIKIKDAAITTAKIQDAAITNAKIESFTFDKGQGGTLTLGGTANGNGVMTVLDSGGTEHVRLDNTGVTVNGGSIVVTDENMGTVMDNLGVANQTVLTNSAVTKSAGYNQQITGTADTAYTDGTITFTLARASNCLFLVDESFFFALPPAAEAAARNISKIKIDGTERERVITQANKGSVDSAINDNLDLMSMSMHSLESLSAGTHSFVVTSANENVSGGAGTLTIHKYKMTYIRVGS